MKYVFLIVFFCIPVLSYSQSYDFTGTVTDSIDMPLIGATVVFLNPQDSVMAGFGITNGKGKFTIDDIKEGSYSLQITYIGYGTFENLVEASGSENDIDLGNIKLAGNANMLDAVEIKGRFIPLVVKKDTVEYNADAYRVRPNATVEELLKKMPGIEVDKDGSIKAQGEDVNKVTVDGKSFFGNDPKAATKNLPADAIKKVQVIDEKSKNTQFSGVDDGNDSKTINLELKEDKKKGYFGNVETGYGTDDRNSSKFNINSFNKKVQFSVIAGYNNINDNGFSYGDYQTLLGDNAFRGNRFNSPINLSWGDKGNGDSRNLNGGANFNYDLGKKSNFSASYFLVDTDINSFNNNNRVNSLGERASINNDTSVVSTNGLQHVINTKLRYKIDSTQRLDASVIITSQDSRGNSFNVEDISKLDNSLISSTATDNGSSSNTLNVNAEFDYNLRLGKPGRVLGVVASYGNLTTDNLTELYQEVLNPIELQRLLLFQDQKDTVQNDNFKIKLGYKEPLGNDQYIDLDYTRRNFKTYRLRDFIDNQVSQRDYALSSATDNKTNYDNYQVRYTLDKPALLLISKLTLHRSFIGSESFQFLENTDELIKVNNPELEGRTFNALLPELSIRLFDRSLRISYSTDLNDPDIQDLQTIVDNTNPNKITLGNPNLRPEYEHRISVRYRKFDRFTLRSLFGNMSYTFTEDNIIDSISVSDKFVETRQPINAGGSHRIRGWLSFQSPIKPLYVKTRISANGGVTFRENFINAQKENIQNWSPSFGIEFENLNNDHFTAVVFARHGWNKNIYENETQRNTTILTQTFGGELIIEFGKGWILDTDISNTSFINDGEQFNSYSLWNASVSKTLWNDKLTLSLDAFDILDQNRGIDISQTSTYLERSRSNTLQQYAMFRLTYKISSFGGAGGNSQKRMIIRR